LFKEKAKSFKREPTETLGTERSINQLKGKGGLSPTSQGGGGRKRGTYKLQKERNLVLNGPVSLLGRTCPCTLKPSGGWGEGAPWPALREKAKNKFTEFIILFPKATGPKGRHALETAEICGVIKV